MLCLGGRHVKALGRSFVWPGYSWGKLDLFFFFFPESSFFWLLLAFLILLVQRNGDLSCLFPQAEAAPVRPQHVADGSQEHLAALQQYR